MKKNGKRILALFLCLLMIVSMLPTTAFAAEAEEIAAETEPIVEVVDDVEKTANEAEEPAAEPEVEEPMTEEPTAVEPAAPAAEEPTSEEPAAPETPTQETPAEIKPVRVAFVREPESAEITVYLKERDENGEKQVVRPEEDGSYLLLPGDYLYDAACEGCVTVEAAELKVTVPENEEVQKVEVRLTAAEAVAEEEPTAPAEGEAITGETEGKAAEGKDAAKATASGTCGDNLTWTLDNDGVLTISGTGPMENYYSLGTVPWYFNRSSIKTVVIEYGVTSIGHDAFSSCDNLTSVTIPGSIESIGKNAFSYSTSLTDVTIPDSVTSIGGLAFSGCSGLTSVTIPGSVTSIGDYAFKNCSNLTSVTISDGVQNIGDYTFENCSSLTNVTIPLSVSYMGGYAFRECTSLTSVISPLWKPFINCPVTHVTVPAGETRIRHYAFQYCNTLTDITLPDSVTCIGNDAFSGCSALTHINIPAGVTSIEHDAFEYCRGLTTAGPLSSGANIEFGWETSIPSDAFRECTSLTSVTIPEGVTSIGYGAFQYCSGLESITIPEGVTSIEAHTFDGCSGLTSVTLPATLTSIEEYAFSGCSGLTSVTIPDGVISIGESAFYDCSALTNITIPVSVTSIGYQAFVGCSSLTDVTSTSWGNFENCPVTHVTIPDGVTSIENFAFFGCSGLTSVTIPSSVTSIGDSAFSGCSGLESITIPDGVTSIGIAAFKDCSGLTSVTIPENVTSIGGDWFDGGAFENCSGLTSITIPQKVKTVGLGVFRGCTNLTEIHMNGVVREWGGGVFSDCTSLTSVVIPDGTRTIPGFSGCASLRSVTIPASVTEVDEFSGCTSLTSITIPEGVETIGYGAFSGCTALEEVSLPKSLKKIDQYAFSGCTALTTFTIPENVWNLSRYAFENCTSLTSVVILGNVHTITEGAFKGCTSLTSVDFRGSYGWDIEKEAFYGCSALQTIVLPSGVQYIRESAFEDCVNLNSITLPNSLSQVDYYAFFGCDRLTDVYYYGSSTSWAAITIGGFNEPLTNATRHYLNPVTGVKLNMGSASLTYGKTLQLAATVLPGDAEEKTVTWSSSNTKVATVDGKGLVKAVGGGKAVITVKTTDGEKTASCTVTVNLATPTLTGASSAYGGVKVSWKAIDGADSYTIQRKIGTGKWKTLKTGVTESSFKDTAVKAGTKYTYRVKAVNLVGSSKYSTAKSVTYYPAPTVSSAKNAAKGVTVSWKAAAGAAKYQVYRKEGNGGWKKLKKVSGTSYTDTTVQSGVKYTYTVRSLNSKGKLISGYNTTGKSVTFLKAPAVKSVANAYGGVTVKWAKVTGADSYTIYRQVGSGKWAKLKAGVTGTSFTDTNVKAKTKYTYKVQAVGASTSVFGSTKSVTYYPAPVLSSVKNAAKGVTVSWKAATGAAKYQVYRKVDGGSWKKLKVVTARSYTDTTAESGTTYTYTVRSLNSSGKAISGYDTTGKSVTRFGAVTLADASNTEGGILVSWKAEGGAAEYQVYRQVGSGDWAALESGLTGTSYTDTDVTPGIQYSYKVRVAAPSTGVFSAVQSVMAE